jgi:hypothetical protein
MKNPNSLIKRLQLLLLEANHQALSIKKITDILSDKGQATLLLFFSLPCCIPISIPGFSTPFGIAIAFIGWRIALSRPLWLPKTLMKKEIPYRTLEKIVLTAIKITKKLNFLISTRWVWLIKNPYLRFFRGLTISLLGLLLALPLPIPLTNLLCAFPIFLFSLAILADDGLLIILAYLFSALAVGLFTALFWFGKELILNKFSL